MTLYIHRAMTSKVFNNVTIYGSRPINGSKPIYGSMQYLLHTGTYLAPFYSTLCMSAYHITHISMNIGFRPSNIHVIIYAYSTTNVDIACTPTYAHSFQRPTTSPVRSVSLQGRSVWTWMTSLIPQERHSLCSVKGCQRAGLLSPLT